jgi:hypothetical protein
LRAQEQVDVIRGLMASVFEKEVVAIMKARDNAFDNLWSREMQ